MNLYDLITLVHVGAAVGLLACSIMVSPGLRSAVRRAHTTQEMRTCVALGRPVARLEPMSAVIVLASGIYLTSVASFWTLGWVQVAVACWGLNAAVAATFVNPAMNRLAGLLATSPDGPVDKELEQLRSSTRWSVGGDILMATDAAMLVTMVMQPGLMGSLIVVVAINAGVAIARPMRTRKTGVAFQRTA